MKTLKIYKIDIKQFNQLLDVKHAAEKKTNALARDFMESRSKRYYSKADARKALRKYAKAGFALCLDIVEV